MRSVSLTLILLCEIVIALTWNADIDTAFLNFLTTLVVVVISAFTGSALLRNFKSLALARNYMISGLIGVFVGVFYYNWVSDHLDNLLNWLKSYGLYALLLIIFVSALFLYFVHPATAKTESKRKANIDEDKEVLSGKIEEDDVNVQN